MCPVHHGGDPTSTENRLMSVVIPHFEALKRGQNDVLKDLVRADVLDTLLGTYCVNPAGKYSGMPR